MTSDLGRCAVCGGLYVVKKDGTLRHHLRWVSPVGPPGSNPRCPGAGKEPKEALNLN